MLFREFVFLTKIYLQNAAITSNKQWMEVCGISSKASPMDFLGFRVQPQSQIFQNIVLGFAAVVFVTLCLVKFIQDRRASQRRPRLIGDEVSQVVCNDYGSVAHTRREEKFR